MQNPNEDTEWNAALRHHKIIPQREKELTEADIVNLVERTVESKQEERGLHEMTVDELNEKEDDIDEDDERMFEEYRRQRLAELRAAQMKAIFGEVGEISKADYVDQVNKAGEGIWVVLHVYKNGVPLCSLINNHLTNLARKFPQTKFLKSVSSVCIPNYPDKNLPTIFVYFEGDLKKQWIGPFAVGGMNLKQDELEWMLAQAGAVQSDIEKPQRPEIQDVMTSAIRQSRIDNGDDSDDN